VTTTQNPSVTVQMVAQNSAAIWPWNHLLPTGHHA